MGTKEGFLFLLLVFSCTFSDARFLLKSQIIEGGKMKKDEVCTVCEDFTNQAIAYIAENKTQDQIVEHLHKACSQIKSFEQQCDILVDYYATLFFAEISNINPQDFCKEVNLCETSLSFYLKTNDTCTFCHHLVDEVLTKLKDPDAQFEILEMLLKECSKLQGHVQECKKIVLEYTPLILVNGEKFLEKNDICTVVRACPVNKEPYIKSIALEMSSVDA